MEQDQWLCGWREIGKYIGKSGRTAQRYARDGMPFFRDPAGRPIAKPSMIDQFIVELNQENFDSKKWLDEGIDMALGYEEYNKKGKEKAQKDFEERVIHAQRPTRGRF